jgi:hypothetical protein
VGGNKVNRDGEVAEARGAMLDAALQALAGFSGGPAEAVRGEYGAARAAGAAPIRSATAYDDLRPRTQCISAPACEQKLP